MGGQTPISQHRAGAAWRDRRNAAGRERAVRFEDVPKLLGRRGYCWAAARELLQGTGLAEFSPEEHLTRAMLMTVLARIEGIDTQGTPWYEKGFNGPWEGVSDGSEPRPHHTGTAGDHAVPLFQDAV